MNLHMPQDEESDIELKLLACVQNNIISPANNKSIIGIFQDSLLSAYLFSKDNLKFTPLNSMNLLAHANNINLDKINFNDVSISNFDILTQILPNLSIEYKTKKYDDSEDYKTSNNVVEIKNGKYIRGVIDKNILGDTTRGIIHRIFNDYNETTCSKFIDDFQNIITEYMKQHGYSVGISDLISNSDTNNRIVK